jgi:hypothetical protein
LGKRAFKLLEVVVGGEMRRAASVLDERSSTGLQNSDYRRLAEEARQRDLRRRRAPAAGDPAQRRVAQ